MEYEIDQRANESKIGIKVLLILIFITLIFILFYTLYLLFTNIPGKPVALNISINEELFENFSGEIKQFYHNMKYNHNNVTFGFHNSCDDKKKGRMKRAFSEVENKVNSIVTFIEVNNNSDIDIECEEKPASENEGDFLIAGEGGAKEIIPTGRFNVIKKGVIYLYNNEGDRYLNCDNSNVEIHELMHAFGFDHSNDENSLMYIIIDSCSQLLDESILNEIKRLYSMEDLPDIYFDRVYVVKKGRYIDFNITIKNSGSIFADNITMYVLDGSDVINNFSINNINYGGGIFIETTNLRLKRLNPEKIEFIIDKDNRIKEIDEQNNIAVIELNKT